MLGWAGRLLCGTVRLVVEIKKKVPGAPRTTIKAEGGSSQIWVEVDNAMINRREHRIGMWIAVAAIMLLTMGISGCGGSKPSNPRGTPNGTLNELEKAIRREDIDAMLACYTDPYYVIVGGEATSVTHDIARIAYAIAFAAYDYSTWSLVGRNVTMVDSEAFASCTQTMYFGGEWASAPVMYRMCSVGSMWYIYEESTVDLAYGLGEARQLMFPNNP